VSQPQSPVKIRVATPARENERRANIAVEHTLSPDAVEWFERIQTAVLKRPGGIFTGSLTLHEPRGVMFATQILERLIARDGKASGFF
jgi:hypothetical protein